MGIKNVGRLREGQNHLTEGPFDFVRGAGAAAGQKIAQSGVGRAVGDVVNAGRQASAVGNLQAAVVKFVKLMQEVDKLSPQGSQQQVRQEPSMNAAQQQQQQQQQQQKAQPRQRVPDDAAPAAFRTQNKPKVRRGKYGDEWTFDSFLHDLYGSEEQLNEGVMDFVKGAGREAWEKARAAVKSYGERPSMIKDLYNAGRAASAEGDQRRQAERAQQAKQKALEQLAIVLDALKAVGPQAGQALQQVLQRVAGNDAVRYHKIIQRNAAKNGIRL